jgi:AcrR family transcriptional regulator
MPRPSRKEQLLQAAAAIVEQQGVEALTLDAVAQQTATSKGGVLYHFPTKQALVEELIGQLLQRFESRLTSGPDEFLERFVLACVTPDPVSDRAAAGLAVAIAADPALLEPLRRKYATWTRRLIASAPHPTDAWLIRLTLDGLWFSELLGLPVPGKAQRELLARRLLELSKTDR